MAPVTDIDILVTDSGVEQKYVDQLREMGVQIIVAEVQQAEASKETAKPVSAKDSEPLNVMGDGVTISG